MATSGDPTVSAPLVLLALRQPPRAAGPASRSCPRRSPRPAASPERSMTANTRVIQNASWMATLKPADHRDAHELRRLLATEVRRRPSSRGSRSGPRSAGAGSADASTPENQPRSDEDHRSRSAVAGGEDVGVAELGDGGTLGLGRGRRPRRCRASTASATMPPGSRARGRLGRRPGVERRTPQT